MSADSSQIEMRIHDLIAPELQNRTYGIGRILAPFGATVVARSAVAEQYRMSLHLMHASILRCDESREAGFDVMVRRAGQGIERSAPVEPLGGRSHSHRIAPNLVEGWRIPPTVQDR